MDTISVLLVNKAFGGLVLLSFNCFGIEGIYHLRWWFWIRNKILAREDSHCLRRLGNFISNGLGYQVAQRCCCWLTVYLVDTVSVPYLFTKVKSSWDFLLRLELRSGLMRESQDIYSAVGEQYRLITRGYLTRISLLSVSDGQFGLNRRFRSEKILSLAVMKSKLFTISTRVPALMLLFGAHSYQNVT